MPVVSLSFFRFDTLSSRLWAFLQMGLARRHLRRLPNIDFFKMFGSGTGEGFDPKPNFAVYAVMAVWPSLDVAYQSVGQSACFMQYRQKAAAFWSVYMTPFSSRGLWDGRDPFPVNAQERRSEKPLILEREGGPVAVLTRATLKHRHIFAFWRQVPDINKSFSDQEGLLFKKGLGEVPWLHQVTFTIWKDHQSMRHFAYTGAHRHAIREVRNGDWFAEELFAQFDIVASEGQWGQDGARASQFPDPLYRKI